MKKKTKGETEKREDYTLYGKQSKEETGKETLISIGNKN